VTAAIVVDHHALARRQQKPVAAAKKQPVVALFGFGELQRLAGDVRNERACAALLW